MNRLRAALQTDDVQTVVAFAAGALAYAGYVLWTHVRGAAL